MNEWILLNVNHNNLVRREIIKQQKMKTQVACMVNSIRPDGRSDFRRVYPKVSGLAAWSENCKWYSSLPLGAVVSLSCESVL
jgi:hypothetical protein